MLTWVHNWKWNLTMVQFHPWFSPRIGVVSQVLDQELMCALKEKTQDPMRCTKWNGNESSHDVFYHNVMQSCGHLGNKIVSPWRNMRTVWAILPMKMLILLECSIKHGAFCVVAQHSQLSNLRDKASVLLVKHQSRKVSFLRCCLLCFVLLFGRFDG